MIGIGLFEPIVVQERQLGIGKDIIDPQCGQDAAVGETESGSLFAEGIH